MYPSDIRPLTSLRIGAALWVLVYHFRNHLELGLDRYGLAAKGYLGVDLFFILSGFILAHVYVRAWSERRFNYGSFLWARLARVYPVHLVTLAATIAIWLVALKLGVGFDPQAFDPRMLPQHLLLVHAWGTTPTVQWNFPSWSISAEWFAYLGFPLAALTSLALKSRPRLLVLAALALFAVMFLVAQARGVLFTDMSAQVGALRIVPAFLMGVALHRLGSKVTLPAGTGGLGAWAAVAWVAVAASLRLSDLYIWPALALLIFCLAETSKAARSGVLSAPVLVYLGEVSYSVYMVHLPVDILYFHALGRFAPALSGPGAAAAWGGAFVACLLAAIVTHHVVERPARDWLRAHDLFARRPAPEPDHEPVL